ncbi:hypothetical protein [Streptomyces javensis]|uniref:Uncharacterized protein n=1 Tax=Streptomyces javensis TaxID=114698 RepID=A0ABS0RAZ3_9ACTN|nr:hypothetical protein [Streptomyces javensis]MBI0314109.1 hypothetical protein [Streptomyces javensis]
MDGVGDRIDGRSRQRAADPPPHRRSGLVEVRVHRGQRESLDDLPGLSQIRPRRLRCYGNGPAQQQADQHRPGLHCRQVVDRQGTVGPAQVAQRRWRSAVSRSPGSASPSWVQRSPSRAPSWGTTNVRAGWSAGSSPLDVGQPVDHPAQRGGPQQAVDVAVQQLPGLPDSGDSPLYERVRRAVTGCVPSPIGHRVPFPRTRLMPRLFLPHIPPGLACEVL